MHVVRPLIGVDRLEVLEVPHHVILAHDAVAAMHVASRPRNVQRLAAIVALDEADRFRRQRILVEQPADAQRSLQAQRDLGLHVGQLLLDKLRGRERAIELDAFQRIVAGTMPAVFGGPSTPQEMP